MEKTNDGQFEIIIKKGSKIVIIPEGTILYRGAAVYYNNTEEDLKGKSNRSQFFGFNPSDVDEYGIIHEYKVKQELRLYKVDDYNTLQNIYNISSNDIRKIIKNNYGYDEESSTLKDRVTIKDSDRKFADSLCNDVDGYYSEKRKLDKWSSSSYELIREMTICNAYEKVELVTTEIIKDIKDNRDVNSEEYKKYISNKMEYFAQKKAAVKGKRGRNDNDESNENNKFYETEIIDNYSTPTKKGKSLFVTPGGKNKSKKSKKSKKAKKQTRKKKGKKN